MFFKKRNGWKDFMEIVSLIKQPNVLLMIGILLLPTIIISTINSLFLFILFVFGIGLFSRDEKLGSILVFFIFFITIMAFYNNPSLEGFIIDFLRIPTRGSSDIPTAELILSSVPKDFFFKVILAAAVSILYSLFGYFLGYISKKIFGNNELIEGEE